MQEVNMSTEDPEPVSKSGQVNIVSPQNLISSVSLPPGQNPIHNPNHLIYPHLLYLHTMNLPVTERHKVSNSLVALRIDLEIEAAHLVSVVWWIEDIQLEIHLNMINQDGDWFHNTKMKPRRTQE